MRRLGPWLFGLAGFAAAIVPMAYFAFFLAGIAVPKTIDSGPAGDPRRALAVDLALLLSFAIVHSVMARPAAKRLLTLVIPETLERSLYSLVAGAQITALIVFWRPLPEPVWSVASELGRGLLWLGQGAGWLVILASLAVVDATYLFGWRQARAHAASTALPATALSARGPYRFVRHPLYSGTILAMFSAPDMSRGRLLLAVTFTVYLVIGYRLEERDLERTHGESWRAYRRAVPPLVPRLGRDRRAARPLDRVVDPPVG